MNPPNRSLLTDDLGLFTDLYELTMAQAFYNQEMFAPATFSLFTRTYPRNRGYLVSAGLEDVLDYLEHLRFTEANIEYLRSIGAFTEDFLQYLSRLSFTGSVRAISEGRLYFANESVLEITAPIIEAQLVETFIINQINFQSLLATKAARCVWAAPGKTLSDFSSRRTHGMDAALKMARCSYIGGFGSTSNVLASKQYGIPPAGTMAHSFVSSFRQEIDAFQAYAASFPDRSVFLLDTYDTIEGARRATQVAKEMEDKGHHLVAVRLDSGNFDNLSREVRHILDEAGLGYVKVLVSGGLDEFELEKLVGCGAPIDLFGVGTRVGVSSDAPYSEMAYKLVCYDSRPVTKLSVGKAYVPGGKQVYRISDDNNLFTRDIIALEEERQPGGTPLLVTVMHGGQRTQPSPSLIDIRQALVDDLQRLPEHYKRLHRPPLYPVVFTDRAKRLTAQVQEQIAMDNYLTE